MTSWVLDALPSDDLQTARTEVARRLLAGTLGVVTAGSADESQMEFIAEAAELAVLDLLDGNDLGDDFSHLSAEAFQLFRVLEVQGDGFERGKTLLRLACLGVLGERGMDVSRHLKDTPWPDLPLRSSDWGDRTFATTIEVWLRLLRKDGWDDLQRVQEHVLALRSMQGELEPTYLERLVGETSRASARSAAWRLMALYHLAKAAEALAVYTTQGRTEDGFDIREQLQAQFDYAITNCVRAELVEIEPLVRLLAATASQLVDNSIWTATRAINPRISAFVEEMVSPSSTKPIFELLPPQRRAIHEGGLRGGERAVVINMPTSSGKTFLAEFRILQALTQFEAERGWVAYIAPTRTLVNQVCARLRRDFTPLGINVERVSPALEIDGLESRLLTEESAEKQFRVLVTTPEKLDLLIRGGWEEEIGRPLSLVVVDEAHNLAIGERGIKLELLLATINRECRNAQFLLLTPFVPNGEEIATWLDPQSHSSIEMAMDWQPNDRAIALSRPVEREGRGFALQLETLHTNRHTLAIPEQLTIGEGRPLNLTYKKVTKSGSDLAAVTADALKSRGPVVVLSGRPDWAWSLAERFKRPEYLSETSTNTQLVQRYLTHEFGADFELQDLLRYRVGVHHAGLSDEAKVLIEWLFENREIDILVATTTIAQGVNFPIASVVVAQHQQYDGSKTVPMNTADFWNLAGRVGRADQSNTGIVALAAPDDEKALILRDFVQTQVVALNSTLISMVDSALLLGNGLQLHTLFNRPEWSAFLQYLAHSFRQIGDPDKFSQQIDLVLRGTFGFQRLRETNFRLAQQLIESARAYGARLAGRPLKLVDTTGFSWESVSITLGKLAEERISEGVWDPASLYREGGKDLRRLMGILLTIPELRDNLEAATGGDGPNGDLLARIITDWVNGASLPDLAAEYFTESNGKTRDSTEALTECCRNLFGRLTQTASWGLGALQAMTLKEEFDRMPEDQQVSVRNLPSRAFYGVNTDPAITLRVLGVPRNAAQPLADELGIRGNSYSLLDIRESLSDNEMVWTRALGDAGQDYRRVWQILEAVR
jgi:hypothetical protein